MSSQHFSQPGFSVLELNYSLLKMYSSENSPCTQCKHLRESKYRSHDCLLFSKGYILQYSEDNSEQWGSFPISPSERSYRLGKPEVWDLVQVHSHCTERSGTRAHKWDHRSENTGQRYVRLLLFLEILCLPDQRGGRGSRLESQKMHHGSVSLNVVIPGWVW